VWISFFDLQNQVINISKNLNPDFGGLNQNAASEKLSIQEVTTMEFTVKASTSPSTVDAQLTKDVIDQIYPEPIVELVTWISILQALHRLEKLPFA